MVFSYFATVIIHRNPLFPPMERLSNYHEDHPNQHKNSYKLCNERGDPVVNLMESKRKMRKQRDQNFLMGEAIVEQIVASQERKKSKTAGPLESQSGIQVGKLTI